VRRAVVLLLAVTLLGGACGNGDGAAPVAARVPVDLVPARLLDDSLGVFENRDPSTLETFANAGTRSLVADTRVWEIRRGDRLVATLQISTVKTKVDLTDEDVRERFADQLILGESSRIRTGDVEVFTSTVDDKTVFLWFASNLYQVMQTKDVALEPEELLADLVAHQEAASSWEPLPELVDFE
jgi:hypothetical protein